MRILILSALCASLLLASPSTRMAAGAPGQAAKAAPAAKTATAAPAQERDPICGMSVDPAKAKSAELTSEYEGKTFYFCNESCKKQFDTDPAKFAAQAAAGGTESGKSCCGCCGKKASGGMKGTGGMRGRGTR